MEGLPQDRILDPDERPIIFVGMDANPYVEAMREDFKLTLVTTGIIFLLGMGSLLIIVANLLKSGKNQLTTYQQCTMTIVTRKLL